MKWFDFFGLFLFKIFHFNSFNSIPFSINFTTLQTRTGEYQVIGRVVHMNYVQEYLAAKEKMKFGNVQRKPNRIQLEVLADTMYIEVCIKNSMNSGTFMQELFIFSNMQKGFESNS